MIDRNEIEDLALEARQIACLSLSIENAMYYGPNTAETYYDALSAVTDLMSQHADKLRTVINKESAALSAEKPQ